MSEIKTVEKRELDFSSEEIQLIKETVAKGTTDVEFRFFLELAKRYDLDPFKKQIWCVKYGNSPATIFTGRDGFLHIAHKSGLLKGFETYALMRDPKTGEVKEVDVCPDPRLLIGAKCYVYRKDWERPVIQSVLLREYNTGKSNWAKMPETMIKKVAESMALRKAFDVSGLYAPEEFDQVKDEQYTETKNSKKYKPTQKTNEDIQNPLLIQVLKEKVRILSEILGVKEEMILHELEKRAKKPIGEFTNDERNQSIKYLVKWIEKEEKARKTEPELIIEEPYEEDEQLMAEAVKLWQE